MFTTPIPVALNEAPSLPAWMRGAVSSQFSPALSSEPDRVTSPVCNHLSFLLKCDIGDMRLTTQEKRLYKELKDETNFSIVKALARSYPTPMGVQQLRNVTGLSWTGTRYHVTLLEKPLLVKAAGRAKVVEMKGIAKRVYTVKTYRVSSRALLEYGILEELLCQQDGVGRLAKKLGESMREHGVETSWDLLMRLASFTCECVRLGLFDDLREFVRDRISGCAMKHSYHSEDLSIHFIRAFLSSDLYRKYLLSRNGRATRHEIKVLLDQLMEMLRSEDPHRIPPMRPQEA